MVRAESAPIIRVAMKPRGGFDQGREGFGGGRNGRGDGRMGVRVNTWKHKGDDARAAEPRKEDNAEDKQFLENLSHEQEQDNSKWEGKEPQKENQAH